MAGEAIVHLRKVVYTQIPKQQPEDVGALWPGKINHGRSIATAMRSPGMERTHSD